MKKIYFLGLAAMLMLASCDSSVFDIGSDPAQGSTFKSDENSPISNTLEKDGRFGEFVNVLNVSGLYNALNQSSDGVSFTVFAPTDEAMNKFEVALGSKVADASKEYARSFVLYHTVKDSIQADQFVNKTSITSLTKDKINVKIDVEHSGQAILSNSNSQAQVIEMGLPASNGKIYVLSSALTPLVETLADRISGNSEYSILNQAVKETGWDKILNTVTDTMIVEGVETTVNRNYSVLAVNDATFAKANISSLEQLKQKLAEMNTDATVSADSLLRAYVGYHIINSKNTLDAMGTVQGDNTSRLWSTGASNLVFTLTTDTTKTAAAERYAINTASGTPVHFVENESNVLALNGYLHQVDSWMPVWEPAQQMVVWDLAADNEIKSLVEDASVEYQPEVASTKQQLVSLSRASCFTHSETETKNTTFAPICYYTTLKPADKAIEYGAKQANNNDCIVFNLGNTGTASMQTPTLVRGKYKVLLDVVYTTSHNFMRQKTDGSGGTLEVTFDGKDRNYVAPYTLVKSSSNVVLPGVYTTVLYDEIEFDSTSSHTFSFKVKDGAASTNKNFSLQFDTITFVPVND